MTKKRRIFLVAGGIATVTGIVVSCSFPDPDVIGDSFEGGADTRRDTAPDTPDLDGGEREGDAFIDVQIPDTGPPPSDATSEKPPVDANCNPCDCDNDNAKTRDAAACPDAGGPRLDCDDLDSRAFPDAGFRVDFPTKETKGDWNCNGQVERRYAVLIECSAHTIVEDCNAIAGFRNDPSCGAEDDYVTCKYPALGTACAPASTKRIKQECK